MDRRVDLHLSTSWRQSEALFLFLELYEQLDVQVPLAKQILYTVFETTGSNLDGKGDPDCDTLLRYTCLLILCKASDVLHLQPAGLF